MSKLTKQGVRDLNAIHPNKSKGKKYDPLPPAQVGAGCKHRRIKQDPSGYIETCLECGETFDVKW